MPQLIYLLYPIVVSFLMQSMNAQQYELPPSISSEDKNIRLNEIQQLWEPNIFLDKVYRRQVYKVEYLPNQSNQSMLTEFPPCKESPPEIAFKNIGYFHLEQPSNPYSQTQQVTNSVQLPMRKSANNIIYDYEVLKAKTQNIIDMAFYDNQIFTISSTAIINVYKLNPDVQNGISLQTSLKGIDWDILYQLRMDKWKLDEQNEKHRLETIDQINRKIAQREKREQQAMEDATMDENNATEGENGTLLGDEGQQQTVLAEQEQTPSGQQSLVANKSSTEANNATHRLLEEVDFRNPSPPVTSDPPYPSPKVSSPDQPTTPQDNATYLTAPPPQQPKAFLQKGYFQMFSDNKLLVFANNNYLMAYDIMRGQSILLSEQLAFDFLFAEKENKTNTTAGNVTNNKSNATVTNNQTSNSPKVNNEPNVNEKKVTNNVTTDNKTQSNKTSTNTTTTTNQTTINDTSKSNTTNTTTPNKTTNQTSSPQKEQEIPPYPQPVPKIPQEFSPLSQFQEIAKINETHFALVDRKNGIIIYEILKRRLNTSSQYMNNPQTFFIRKAAFIGRQMFGRSYQDNEELNLIDISFYKNKSLLLVLDYEKGVFAFQRPTPKNMTNQTIQQSHSPPFVLSSYTILKKMCNLMEFSEPFQTLYLSCNKIYRISLQKWPKISEKTFEHPLINIREIFVEQDRNLLILSGYSVFKVMYLDRTTNYFQNDMLDKIIFNKDLVITANQNHIIALKYRVEKPTIICSTSNKSLLGVHSLVLRTTAQCSEPYLKSINYTKPKGQNDICVYTHYKNVFIWEQGEVPLKPLAIVLLVFLIFIVVMIIWFILVKFRMQSAQQRLKYLSQEGGHEELVEEEVRSSKNVSHSKESQKSIDGSKSQAQNPKSEAQDISMEEEDPNKDLYSIE